MGTLQLASDENLSSDDSGEFRKLIASAKQGSNEALELLVTQLRPFLLTIANQDLDRAVRQKVAPSDIVQESLMTAQKSIGTFEGSSKPDLKAWMRQILKHDLQDIRRRYHAEKRDVHREVSGDADLQPCDVVDPGYTPCTTTQVAEELRLVRMAMDQLPEHYREVIRLRNWQQLTFEQTGQSMQRTPEAVRKLWTRALGQLELELDRLRYVHAPLSRRDTT